MGLLVGGLGLEGGGAAVDGRVPHRQTEGRVSVWKPNSLHCDVGQ